MAAFVLIHSPFVRPLTWQPTAQTLTNQGHSIVTPALNVGEPNSPYWTYYATCIAAAVHQLPEREPLILVAHSAAGLIIPAAKSALAEHLVHAYIFVDAALPQDGASLFDLLPAGVGVTMERGHLHMLVDPPAVASALVELVS